MIQTSARLLQLLSLLQVRREWTGPALAERMGVTERTVRRDIEKLRNLGYPIHASPGIAGGYQLGAGAQLPPLLLDDNEALAVALGLNSVAAGPVAGIGEASVRALTKLEQVLPSRLRSRFAMLKGAVTALPSNAASVDPQQLTVLSSAIADRRQVSFDYVTSEGESSSRLVEPYRLVDTGRRWYLVAWDVGREDWRTFRADRIASLPSERKRYEPRPLPAEDLAAYVQQSITRSPYRFDVVVRLRAPLAEVAAVVGPHLASLTAESPTSTILRAGWDNLAAPVAQLAALDMDFEIIEPAEFSSFALRLSRRLKAAAGNVTDAAEDTLPRQ
ncbi:transcriptional regulator [Arthrobacter sp. TES]|jgi:predicted DNA-binding transcriptional regulator YafY|uniref:helix-turn-helix transcriptional regulator n=1 Tax=Paenarthrobacter TaxID=1742992 RepID=UPI000397E003|nr:MULTISPECIES: transcriptional regulator [Paenarthrobacter]ERI39314.1 DeoR faimly transcriptional regulator [Arthrobacter sp. AK-YN10]QOI62811.1 transcriptional regulator [Arthrobacter sp. TES]MCX8452614.1 transcriptional regulator [Paenarthrobacter ureafaciens]MCY0971252.1 transcriptional regulator [Paenarthrobacter ureafaciens]QOT16549.1 transcriptional regulator [Paenarthrobacter sp. YJN-5]